ncbi:alpha-L-rhamnosidase C-terminal domain-containing protein [Phytoactinopolyspora mesophila]|uniref:alpha-L-rhamnosidase C-terminal domain-containing protein n=1 Tax=Phytoactinopolyspora mesophila TaxID=2650750 RepID=UPI001C9E6E85
MSSQPVPERHAERDLVVHVDGPHVVPESVTVEGDGTQVTNANGLTRNDEDVTTLNTSDSRSATLIVDLGRVAMGTVEVGVARADGAPIRVAYAQFRQFLRPDGDGMDAPFGTDAYPWSRVGVFQPPDGSAILESPGKRETRYIAITLDGPGQLVIDVVRVRQAIYPVRYDGSFLSSDDLLNRAWYHSAYTGDLATVSEDSSLPGAPEGPSPWMLTVTYDRILFMADLHLQALAGYYQSSDYFWLVRNTLQQFGPVQNPDGSFPAASSHLVNGKPGDPGPPDGWRSPEDGPDPDAALGLAGPYSIHRDTRIDSFTAFWVAALADYYRYTGDAELVGSLLPVARRAVEFLRGRTSGDGLFYEPEDQRTNPDAGIPMVANWSPLDIAAGTDSFSNAVYHDALLGLALLETDVADDPEAGRRLEQQAERVRQALIARLWDSRAGAMILNDDDPLRDHTADANAGNLMFRTLDAQRARSAMAFLDQSLRTPYGTRASEYTDNPYRASDIQGYINAMEALGRVRYGDGQGAVDLIRRWWGHMLAKGPGTGWFAWHNDGSVERGAFANSSWTTALPALSEGVLGVRPTGPGYRRWEVAPQPADLHWAQGRVPTPGGSIAVRWERTENRFALTVEPSQDGEGEVAVPLLGAAREITMDGEVAWRDGSATGGVSAYQRGDAVVFGGIRGEHTFAWGDSSDARESA